MSYRHMVPIILACALASHSQEGVAKPPVPLAETKSVGPVSGAKSITIKVAICDRTTLVDKPEMKDYSYACQERKARSIKDLAIVITNTGDSMVTGTITFRAFDQITSKWLSDEITETASVDRGTTVISFEKLFTSKENIGKIATFMQASNPVYISVEFAPENANTDRDGIVIGYGHKLELSLSATPFMPTFKLNKSETNYSTLGPTSFFKIGYQYVFKNYSSVGISGVAILQSTEYSAATNKLAVWPGVSLAFAKGSSSGFRYSADLIAGYEFVKHGDDNLVLGLALNFGLDLAGVYEKIK